MNKSIKMNELHSLFYTVLAAILAFWGATSVGQMVEYLVHSSR